MTEIGYDTDKIVIRPQIDIVASKADEFRKELISIIQSSPKNLVMDFKEIQMIDSSGIGVVIAAHNSLKADGRRLKIINVLREIFELFVFMRLDRRFTIEMAEKSVGRI